MPFNPGLDIAPRQQPLGFEYAAGVIGPEPELRTLASIRHGLRDPHCAGPDPVYAIAMDVAQASDHRALVEAMLLFGIVTYAAGQLGREPIRSQGHVHRVSSHSKWSPPELYEIWSGRAVILMQEHAADDPGRVYAVEAGPGEKVLVPPGWAHATISADPEQPLTFGALCDREYGFEYENLRKRNGLSWYPLVGSRDELTWEANPLYRSSMLCKKRPRDYTDFGVEPGLPLYQQVVREPERWQWISDPARIQPRWYDFVP